MYAMQRTRLGRRGQLVAKPSHHTLECGWQSWFTLLYGSCVVLLCAYPQLLDGEFSTDGLPEVSLPPGPEHDAGSRTEAHPDRGPPPARQFRRPP